MMRLPIPHALRFLFLALALVFVAAHPAAADDRSDARTHYQAGVKFYAGGDYRSAIREFSAAQQLAPADLNNYNLALCYDKLGDADAAIQYYRAFLDKQPNTDKRPEIEASVQRLDAAAKSAAAKKAEEARRADEAKKAEDARLAAEAKKAEDARLAAEAARQAEEQKRQPAEALPPVGVGSTGTPSAPSPSTGDAQLDRVQGIDINAIRDQRVGGSGSGIPANDPRTPNATTSPPVGGQPVGGQPVGGQAMGQGANNGMQPPVAANGPQQGGMPMNGQPEQPKKATPVYKKWWFWAVVAVSAYVVYQIASDGPSSNGNNVRLLPEVGATNAAPGGMTLLRF